MRYDRLEVSSPGLDRVLRKDEDYVRFAGRRRACSCASPMDGQRNFVGTLRAVNDAEDGTGSGRKIARRWTWRKIEKARLVPNI